MEHRASLMNSLAVCKAAAFNRHILHTGPDRATAIFISGFQRLTARKSGIGDLQASVRCFVATAFVNGFNIDTAAKLGYAVSEIDVVYLDIAGFCFDNTPTYAAAAEVLAVENQIFNLQARVVIAADLRAV